jgi:hypothetical protein
VPDREHMPQKGLGIACPDLNVLRPLSDSSHGNRMFAITFADSQLV